MLQSQKLSLIIKLESLLMLTTMKRHVDAMVVQDNYTQSEADNLLANKVSTTGNVSLNGNLDVGSVGNNRLIIHSTGAATAYTEFN